MCCCSGCRDAFGTLHPGQRPINRSTLARNDRPARSLPVLACTLRRAQSAPLHLTARNHCAPLVKAQAPIRPLLLPYPLLVDFGRLGLCSASMHARQLHGEAAKELYPPSSFFFFFCPRSCRCKWPPCAGGPVQCRRPPQPHTGGHRSAQKTPDA